MSTRTPYTMKQAAQWAIDCQDACNLSGVLSTFQFIVSETLWPEANKLKQGTEYVNRHPIVTLFLSKLCSLNGGSSTMDFMQAWDAVETITKSEEVGQ